MLSQWAAIIPSPSPGTGTGGLTGCLMPAEHRFKLLTAFNRHVEEFRGWLAVDFERNAILLARYEFHGHHPGWHCHAPCGDVEAGDAGALRTRDCRRLPGGMGFHKEQEFDTTSVERALARSFNFFRVRGEDAGPLL